MATATQIEPALMTMEEYLRTDFSPDCDFVDGHIEERNLGDRRHSSVQAWLAFWFYSHQVDWNVRPLTEYRTRVGSKRVRVPDVSVVYQDDAMMEDIRVTPPLVAIEILSPEDRLPRVAKRLGDFRSMGVEHIWLLDPVERIAFTYTGKGLTLVEEPRLTVPNTPIYLDLTEVFACLD